MAGRTPQHHAPDRHAPPFQLSARAIADLVNAELVGDASATITRVATLTEAGPASITFARDEANAAAFIESDATAVMIARAAAAGLSAGLPPERAALIVDDADLALVALLREIESRDAARPTDTGVHPTACVHPDAQVDPSATIGPHAVIESGARIGAHTVIGPGVIIRFRCVVGERVVIHPNAVIGADGFGYRPAPDGRGLVKVPHIGTVIIEHDAEIGAGTCIDRAKLGATRICAGTKIDNLVQIGHNVTVGKACVICGRAGIAGSTTIGDGVVIGGAAGIADNLTIGAGASLAAFSALKDDIPPGGKWIGVPAMPRRNFARILAATRDLPAVLKEVRKHLR